MKPKSYQEAGVDIEKGDAFARYIGSVKSPAVSRGIGGFAGGIEIDTTKYKRPVLLSATDGVGTKLLVAQRLNRFDTLGIDLVAMCVNDLIVCGAEPLVFLDYIATGAIQEDQLKQIIDGIIKGCEDAQCVLAGGETAEMPDLYQHSDFDLAGFSTGIVDADKMLPNLNAMNPGDSLFSLPSSGIHSNGLSLARKIIPESRDDLWEQLLVPTIIYVRQLKKIISEGLISGAAHITGGGLVANTQRILPQGLIPSFLWDWPVPHIFSELQNLGNIETTEMRKVFNMGIGMVLVVPKAKTQDFQSFCERTQIETRCIGELVHG
ncbi:phosphoribosylformylglycinamidine cyclo-ligase [Spirochaeta lutea]|uniref:Phosphoribosylformylglycinamidine cyclo-ligase n=1 Tax=Spirochaeta lutea TaxID=1480694 RepID=A0A098R0D0_9SPIO|nr:phosphoribosylformylglycinamidine cyclo-ligase [Spirochaeta lutea]KGE73625.1 phosphoribosylaminoimidazole synthetase [Spirochaeta lutea]